MDARLVLAIINRQRGKQAMSIPSASSNGLAVVARVVDAALWRELPDVLPGAQLGMTPDGSAIVTGRVAIDRIETVRADAAVRSLRASQLVRPPVGGDHPHHAGSRGPLAGWRQAKGRRGRSDRNR